MPLPGVTRKVEARPTQLERPPTLWIWDDMGVTEAAGSQPRSGAQSIERALGVLRCFEAGEKDLGITEIAKRTSLTISTAHRVTRALTEGGLLVQDTRTERYLLGPTLVVLGRQAADRLGYDQARPALEDLSAATGESVNLGIRTGGEVQVVLDVASKAPLRFDQAPGTRVPLYVSAMGKCLLAGSDELERDIAGLGELARVTERTITDTDALRAELQEVRERGWALNDEERHPGVRAIAVPVHRPGGGVLAAIAVQGPTVRVTDDRLDELAAELRRTAARVAPLLAAAG